jgi:hypothetical protein
MGEGAASPVRSTTEPSVVVEELVVQFKEVDTASIATSWLYLFGSQGHQIGAVMAFIGAGILFGNHFCGWETTESLYFVIVSITTGSCIH